MNSGKKMIVGMLTAVMVMMGMFVKPADVIAAGNGETVEIKTEIVYQETDYETYTSAWGNQEEIPVKEGYLFGGWYEDAEGNTAIKSQDQVAADTDVYAKFVPAHVLSVKAQNFYGTANTEEANSTTHVRLVSTVDTLAYKNVGFEIVDVETGRVITSSPTNTVFSKLSVKKDAETTREYTPQEVFGTISNAKAQKFIVMTLKNIPEAKWSSDVYVRPYWTTFDGVKVQGLGKYVYVQDGIDGWISVPVNLHTGADVAVGLLDVEFNTQYLEYKEYRAGRMFPEMDAAPNGAIIKCVGNVSEIQNVKADDIYIVLRFRVLNGYEVGNGETFLQFAVNNMDFGNVDEESVSMNILNIQY